MSLAEPDSGATVTRLPSKDSSLYRALLAVARERAGGDTQYLAMLCSRFLPALNPEAPELAELRDQFQSDATDFDTQGIFRADNPIDDAMRDLVMGVLNQVVFVDVGPTTLGLVAIECDELGRPVFRGPAIDANWQDVLPSLPGSSVEQAVALASGDERSGVVRERIATTLRAHLDELGISEFPQRTRAVLLQRLFGWAVHDHVRDTVRTQVGTASTVECAHEERQGWALNDVLATAIADAPLRHDYALLAAAIDPTDQSVRIERHPLFYRDQSRKFSSLKDIQILAPPTARDTLQIAIVARVGDRVEDSRLVTSVTAALPAGDRCRLWVQLDGPGAVSFPDAPVELGPLRSSLREIFAAVPPRIGQLHAVSLDLVCVLDLVGNADAVEQRVSRMREVIEYLRQQHPAANNLKIGLLAYRDTIHVQAERDNAPRLNAVDKIELGDPAMVLRKLDTLSAFDHPARDLPGALDIALAGLSGFRWRSNSQHSLFTIAAHPPHPPVQGRHRLIPNAGGHDWFKSIEHACEQLALRSVLAVDELSEVRSWAPPDEIGPAWQPLSQAVEDYIEDCWTRLGYTYRSELNAAGNDVFAEEVDPALAEDSQTLRLPIVRNAMG